ncbi:hypothetical protein [Schnuerera sp.]|uniref:hypothetical protein n=1 Tax=Schnuerera sp. TaxID=2794844 RepID=UPI002C535E82|nr:hypothetical protein [Schnuerera sp.]HSH35232.1 hypothetical protein [Schnuerera sp.]
MNNTINVYARIVFGPDEEIFAYTKFGTKGIQESAQIIDTWIKQSKRLRTAYNDPDSKLIISIS